MSYDYRTSDSIGREIRVKENLTFGEVRTLVLADGTTVTSTGLHLT